jgi:hypothetical protein
MASSQFGARTLALLALGWLGMGAGCYSTTPYRVQVATRAAAGECVDAVTDVFSRSGFIQLPTPWNLSMLFAARTGGPYSSFLSTGSGIGVTVRHDENGENGGNGEGMCRVTLEALSPDAGCPGSDSGPSGTLNCQRQGIPPEPPGYGGMTQSPCPVVPAPICELTSAPGADNDAAVDELARRVQAALGSHGRVN